MLVFGKLTLVVHVERRTVAVGPGAVGYCVGGTFLL